jgi:cob(I)alamin adenosyltransferase
MKIYTSGGDKGKTSLFSGERITKGHLRIEAYGNVDELNSVVGALLSSLPEAIRSQCQRDLLSIQSDLFVIGAWMATTPNSPNISSLDSINQVKIGELETAIDRMDAALSDLHGFILPGGHPSSSWTHVARTVCRRTERQVVRLRDLERAEGLESLLDPVLIYLNRLSDYLFVLARYCNHIMEVPEILWEN